MAFLRYASTRSASVRLCHLHPQAITIGTVNNARTANLPKYSTSTSKISKDPACHRIFVNHPTTTIRYTAPAATDTAATVTTATTAALIAAHSWASTGVSTFRAAHLRGFTGSPSPQLPYRRHRAGRAAHLRGFTGSPSPQLPYRRHQAGRAAHLRGFTGSPSPQLPYRRHRAGRIRSVWPACWITRGLKRQQRPATLTELTDGQSLFGRRGRREWLCRKQPDCRPAR